MATMLPPVFGAAFEFDVVLFAQSDNQIKTTPTITASDFLISKDNGEVDVLDGVPVELPVGSGIIRVVLADYEMEADKVTVKWHDVAGAEWHDGAVCIHTAGQTFNVIKGDIDAILDAIDSDIPNAIGFLYDDLMEGGLTAILESTTTTIPALIADVPTNAELAAAIAAGDDPVLAAIAALNNLSSAGAQAAAAAALTAYGAATATNVTNATSPLATGAALAALNNLSAAQVNAEVDTALADYDPPTKAELDAADDAVLAAIALLNNLSSAGAQAAAAAALAAYDAATGTDVTSATSPLATAAAVAALNNLSQAQAQAAATAALNAYDGPTKTEMDAAFTTADDAVLAAIAALENTSATDFLTALQAMLVDGAITWMELQRVLLALIAGETTGGGTTDLAFLAQDGLTERIAATVDGSGNRTSVTLDGGA